MPIHRNDRDDDDARIPRKGGNPLQRGSACLSCRKRKMKCDASKPVCRQCVKANRHDECDYDDGRQKSRTQILQEKIAKLEGRIRELEDPLDPAFPDAPPAAHAYPADAFADGLQMDMGVGADIGVGVGMNIQLAALGAADSAAAFAGFHDQSHSLSLSPASSVVGAPAGAAAGTFSPLALGASSALPYPANAFAAPQPAMLNVPGPSVYPHASLGTQDALFFGLPASPGSGSGSGSGSSISGSVSGSCSGSVSGSGWGAQQQQQEAGVAMYASSSSSSSATAAASAAAAPGFGMDMGMDMGMGMGMEHAALFENGGMGSGGFPGMAGASSRHAGSIWEAEELPRAQRKMLLDIFLPHAQQCGLDVSPERLYERLEISSSADGFRPQKNNALDDAPPAHPALTNAIFLLACHFSAVRMGDGVGESIIAGVPDLSAHEPHFLTRALRGIAAALEAGEAAASDCSSSSSSSSSSHSFHSSVSPATAAASPTASSPSPSSASSSSSSAASSSSTTFVSALPAPAHAETDADADPGTPLVDAVQASVLLAVYFFAKARLLEGYYHASAAARLAVALGMHQVRSAVWRPPPAAAASSSPASSPAFSSFPSSSAASSASSSSSSPAYSYAAGAGAWAGTPPAPAVTLPAARSARAHAERVSAFWSVFCVDRCWSVATGLPSSLPDDEHPQLKICTVWPWEAGDEVTRASADYSSLASLYDGASSPSRSTKALKAKAAAFFERAARIASMQTEPSEWEQHTRLAYALAQFTASLPPYLVAPSPSPSPSASPSPSTSPSAYPHIDTERALAHTLAHAAAIQLHHPRAQTDARAHAACVRAAAGAVRVVRALDAAAAAACRRGGEEVYALLDPVVGTCWVCVADVLLRERVWGGDMEAAGAARGVEAAEGGGCGVEAALDAVVGALRRLSYVFPVALYQVQKVEQSRNVPF